MAAQGSWLEKPGLLRTLLAQSRLAFRLIREPAVPLLAKSIPALAAVYLIWPLDFLPDLLPVLGQLDDLGVVLAALELFHERARSCSASRNGPFACEYVENIRAPPAYAACFARTQAAASSGCARR